MLSQCHDRLRRFAGGGVAAFLLLVSGLAPAVEVAIPDANFEAALRATTEVPDSGPIQDTDLAAIVNLDAGGYGITNLSGIEYCTELKQLSIGGNSIQSLALLAGLIELDTLSLGNNGDLASLDGIEALVSLDVLNMQNLELEDMSAISGLISLDYIDMTDTTCADFSPLAGLVQLDELYLVNTNITDISPLATCPDLRIVDLFGTPVADISPFSGLPLLANIRLASTLVSDITPLADNSLFRNGDFVEVSGLLLNQESICDAIPALEARGAQVANLDANLNYCDPVPPVVVLNGPDVITLECPGAYNEQGATAEDDYENQDVTGTIVITPALSGALDAGQYILTYTATDAVGNEGTATRTINVLDTAAPVITRTGGPTVTIDFGSAYVDEGATAVDTCDGNVVVSSDNPVNTNQAGAYTVTYTAADAAGNEAAPVTRTVNVIDTVPPVISLLGNAAPTVECGAVYTDPGATAQDVGDGNINAEIVVTGSVDTSEPGVYTLTYSVEDSSGNTAEPLTRSVTVADTTDPALLLSGTAVVNLECGDIYGEPGSSATDTCDGAVDVDVTGFVNVNVAGTYRLTYTAEDSSGNVSVIHRDVVVADGANCSEADPSAYATDLNGDNKISLSELLRVIQFYNIGGFFFCPGQGTEDGFCPGVQP